VVAGLVHRLEAEGEVADDGVVQAPHAGGQRADGVSGPAAAERFAAGGQLADEVGQVTVVRVAAGLAPQQRDGVISGALPVAIEAAGALVEKDGA